MDAFTHTEGGFHKVAAAALAVGVVVATALVGAAVASLKFATEFEADLKLIHTQAGATNEDLGKIALGLEDMATRVATGPDELAKSLYHVESAGFRGAHALDMVEQAAKMAVIGQANIEATTQAVIAVMAAFEQKGMTASRAVAILNATVGVGDMRMEGLAEAMSTGLLPAAEVAGLALTDVGAALATLTDNATPPTEAATRLRMTFSMLAAPTHAAAEALAKIGIKSTQLGDDMRKPNGLLVALGDLKEHLEHAGLTATEQAGIIAQAFGGGRSSAAIETLLTQFDRFKSKYKGINDGANGFAKAWEEAQDTTAVQWKQMQADLQTLGVIAGSALLPLANAVLKAVLPALKQFAIFMQGPGIAGIKAVGGGIMAIVGAFGTFVQGVRQSHSVGTAFMDGMQQLGVSFVDTAPLAGLITDAILTFQPIFNDIGKTVKQFVSDHRKQFQEMFKTTKEIMSAIGDLIHAILEAIQKFWKDHGKEVMAIVSLIWNLIAGIVQDAMKIILDIIHLITHIIKGDWNAVWQDILHLLEDVIGLIVHAIQNLIPLMVGIIKLAIEKTLELGNSIMQGIATGIANGAHWVLDALGKALKDAWKNAKGLIGMSSPSKLYGTMGESMMAGAAGGVDDNKHLLRNALAGAVGAGFGGNGAGPSLVGAGGGGATIVFDMRGSQVMSDRDMEKFAEKLMPALGKAAVGAGIKFRL